MGIVRPARWSRPVHELCALSRTYRSRVPDQSPPAAGVPARKTILRRRLAPSVSQGVAFRKAWRGSAAQAFRKAWRGSSRAGALSGSARRAGALTSALGWRAFRSCGRSLFMRAGPRGGNRLGLCAQRAPICPLAARAGGPHYHHPSRCPRIGFPLAATAASAATQTSP